MSTSRKSDRGKQVRPRPVTLAYLRNAALHYLSTRSASAAMVRQTLERRALRRLDVRALDGEIAGLIDAAVAELVKLGLIDDARFAEGRAAMLAARGMPRGRIARLLKGKGVGEEALEVGLGDDLDDVVQARRFVERKRLGPHRRGGMTPESRRKDLSALARAGFSFGVAARALEPDGDA